MFFACHFQEEHSSLDNKNYAESIFILYRIKYQNIKIDLTSPLKTVEPTTSGPKRMRNPPTWDHDYEMKSISNS